MSEERSYGIYLTEKNMSDFLSDFQKNHSAESLDLYCRALRLFYDYLPNDKYVDLDMFMSWKESMIENEYSIKTVNSRISAVNSLMSFLKRRDIYLKLLDVDNLPMPELNRKEYLRLLKAARSDEKEQIYFIIKTICQVGTRVGELKKITVNAIKSGKVIVQRGSVSKKLIIPNILKEELLEYAKTKNICEGPIFLSKKGEPVLRATIQRDIKALCSRADVEEEKGSARCLLKLHKKTIASVKNILAVTGRSIYESILEEEQHDVKWEFSKEENRW